jgi:15-cis-phytoene synthase
MDHYTFVSYATAKHITKYYSTSFSLSSRLFDRGVRPHIYAIYGLVRVADEIVDTYRGEAAADELDTFEAATIEALKTGYSANPIIHAFVHTAREYGIDVTEIKPFFESMRRDLSKVAFTEQEYERYIYGSAEVVGLMCLKVFTEGNTKKYQELEAGAKALGSAYQKVNFLRDISNDVSRLGRVYFPNVADGALDEDQKAVIIADISKDFAVAETYISKLPSSARRAVKTSYLFYSKLLKKLARTPVNVLMKQRIRVSPGTKVCLFMRGYFS